MRFWDSSAVIPMCIEEVNTPLVRSWHVEDPAMVVWWGTPVECRSAFARLRREGVFSTDDEDRVGRMLVVLARSWAEILPSEEVRRTAGRLLLRHPLRAADALQLAAAILWAGGSPDGQPFTCFDRRLGGAARQEGFMVQSGVVP